MASDADRRGAAACIGRHGRDLAYRCIIFDRIVELFCTQQLELYDASRFWIDVGFYLGWMLGLMFAPSNRSGPRSANSIAGR